MLLLWLQLLVFMFFLIVIGEPLRFLFLRRLRLFADLDFLQVCLLDVYLGGMVLYVIAMLPLQLFNREVVLGLTVFGALFSVFSGLRSFYRGKTGKIKILLLKRRTAIFDYVLLFAMFLILLWIQLIPLSQFVFGSIHDTSLHSLMVEVILKNRYVPVTFQPYLAAGIIYPQASHVVFAYATYVLNYEAPKAVFYVTPLFNSLSVLGAYFFGKKLWSNRSFYLGLSFVFTFVSSWPLYITWGGNPFVVGFPLFLLCLGLFLSVSRSNAKIDAKELVAVGILFGYSAAIIISYLQTLMVLGLLWVVYEFVRRSKYLRSSVSKMFLIFFVSILPWSPFLIRFFTFYHYPGHNIGVPSDFLGYETQQFSLTQAIEWAFTNFNPHPYLRAELLGLLVVLGVLLWKFKNDENTKKVLLFTASIFMAAGLLTFASYSLPASDFGVISWGHQSIILVLPLYILISIFYLKLVQLFKRFNPKWFSKVFLNRSYGILLISTVSLAVINIPFMYYRVSVDPETLASAYEVFAITTQEDYELMLWIRDYLPDEAVVLINPYEAGLFIPSMSHRKVIYPYGALQFTYGYQRLVELLTQSILNTTTYELMLYYNVTHVFVGSHSTYWVNTNSRWNQKTFLGNPNFKPVKNFGNSSLFKLSYSDPNIVFLDEFNYENLTDMGWVTSNIGDGVGEAVITSVYGESYLKINSTCRTNERVDSLYFYETRVSREFYPWATSDVTLSFNINLTSGFNYMDTFAIVISNIYLNRSITIATPNSVFQLLDPENTKTFTIENPAGDFSFNLSRLWRQAYNGTLPNECYLQIRNIDFDGVANIAVIDSIEITYQKG